jgi:pSer/pThr/pTyr-binding forkhead associated (FHA) protein
VKCPSCSSVGELEAFIRAAALAEDLPEEAAGDDGAPAPSGTETVPVGGGPGSSMDTAERSGSIPEEPAATASPAAAESDEGTKIAGTANQLNLPPGIRCVLTVLTGPDSGKKLMVDKPRIGVGRVSGDFPLSDQEVSKEHCAFEITGVTCTVKDLGSRNGTYVEGDKISSRTLSNVGEVVVGNTTLLFTMTVDDAPHAA